MSSGTVVIYILGVMQLILIARFSINQAIAVGVFPFLIGDALKIGGAVLVAVKLKSRLGADELKGMRG
jgi:biotin transport system substrate-specific component